MGMERRKQAAHAADQGGKKPMQWESKREEPKDLNYKIWIRFSSQIRTSHVLNPIQTRIQLRIQFGFGSGQPDRQLLKRP